LQIQPAAYQFGSVAEEATELHAEIPMGALVCVQVAPEFVEEYIASDAATSLVPSAEQAIEVSL